MRSTRAFFAAVITWAMLGSSPAFAWRETGHWAICELGYRHASPATRAALDTLMQGDFASQCTWPDMVRSSPQWKHTYPWHFADIDDGADYFAPGVMNPKGDAVRAVLQALEELRKPETAAADRRVWLRFLGHFYGDLHQPLHVGRKTDAGGNKTTVKWFGKKKHDYAEIQRVEPGPAGCQGDGRYLEPHTGECVRKASEVRDISLHKVWDLHVTDRFIQKNGLTAEQGDSEYLHKAYATAVDQVLTASQRRSLIYSLPLDWVDENLRDRETAYEAQPGENLTTAYYDAAVAVANRRIFTAGVRLAAALDRLLDPAAGGGPREAFLLLQEAELRARIAAAAP